MTSTGGRRGGKGREAGGYASASKAAVVATRADWQDGAELEVRFCVKAFLSLSLHLQGK